MWPVRFRAIEYVSMSIASTSSAAIGLTAPISDSASSAEWMWRQAAWRLK
jgi:hypothetical protein